MFEICRSNGIRSKLRLNSRDGNCVKAKIQVLRGENVLLWNTFMISLTLFAILPPIEVCEFLKNQI